MAFPSFCRALGVFVSSRRLTRFTSSSHNIYPHLQPELAGVRWSTNKKVYVEREKVFEEQLRAYEAARQRGVSFGDCMSFMEACAVARKPKEGRECFEMMGKLGFGYRAGLEGMVQILSNNPEEASKILVEFDQRGVNRSRTAYHTLIYAWSKKNEIVKAQALFDEMEDRKIRIGNASLCAIMSAYLDNKDVGKAMEYFDQFSERKIVPGDRAYGLALKACLGDEKYHDRAFEIFQQMKRAPSQEILNDLLKIACVRKDVDRIVELYNKIEAPGLRTFNTMLFAFHLVGDWKKMQFYFEEMTQKHGILPDSLALQNMVNACGRNEAAPTAFQKGAKYFFALKQTNRQPTPSTMLSLSWCLRRSSVRGEGTNAALLAKDLENVMEMLETVPEFQRGKEWHCLMISVSQSLGESEKVILHHKEMRAKNIMGFLDQAAAKAYNQLGRLDEAVALLEDKENRVEDRVVQQVLKDSALSKDEEKMEFCFKEFLARDMLGSKSLFDLLAVSSKGPKLVAYFDEARKRGFVPRSSVYDSVTLFCPNRAIDLLQEMRKKGVVPKLRTLRRVIPLIYKENFGLEEEWGVLLEDLQKAGLTKKEAEEYLEIIQKGE